MQVNIPEVVAELVGCFESYERALVSNDIEAVNAMFWESSCTVRYGTRENEIHCGHSAISAFRRARGPVDQRRTLRGTHITTFGQTSVLPLPNTFPRIRAGWAARVRPGRA